MTVRVVATANAVACGLLALAYVDTGEQVFLGAMVLCAIALGCCFVEMIDFDEEECP